VAVVTPVYSATPSIHELQSLEQCDRVLSRYPRFIITAPGLDLGAYRERAPGFDVAWFDAAYFADLQGYNRLMLSRTFYGAFASFRHVLIHQLDALVFSDRLAEWCSRDYDYVGPPWFEPVSLGELGIPTLLPVRNRCIGNGGFSLRKVKAFRRVLFWLAPVAGRWQANEDLFWSLVAANYDPFFRVPSFRDALSFGFETRPRECFDLLGRLPFGCHGWARYDVAFWRPFLAELGIKV
jgi:hypothetical protein